MDNNLVVGPNPFRKSNTSNVPSNESNFETRKVTDQDLIDLANSLGIKNINSLKAIESQESKRSAFYKPGQATILYERHYMYNILAAKGADVKTISKQHPDIVNPVSGAGGLYSAQYKKLAEAKNIDEGAAIQSSSWGKYQVMGSWYANRYKSPQELEKAMNTSEMEQLLYFGAYLKNTKGMIKALNDENWEQVAYLYNGPKWRVKNPNYANNLRKYFNSH